MNKDILFSVLILVSVIVIAVAFIFFGVFVAIVKGAMEEDDSEYEFCTIVRVSYKDGKWYANAGAWFDENAVLKITFATAFVILFHDFEFVLKTSGEKVGSVNGNICQNLRLLRRKIRRI